MTSEEAIEIAIHCLGVQAEQEVCEECDIYGNCHTDCKDVARVGIEAFKEFRKYREIGTVEECQEAREKQKPKAVKNRKLLKDFHGSPYCIQGDCPNCGCESIKATATDYCYVCGQHLKWNENLEGMEDE